MENAIIQLERKRAWADLFRSYQIFLDAELVGTIRQGKSCSFEVHPGHHELFLTIDWCSSQRLSMDLAPGEKVKVVCQGKNALFALYNVTFGADRYINLFQEPFQDLLSS